MGFDELQGYFFARRMPASELLQRAAGNKPEGAADFAPSVVGEPPF